MNEHRTISLQNETSFKALFQYASIGILVINDKGYIELANPYSERLFNYSLDELTGQALETLIPAKFKSDYQNFLRIYFKNLHRGAIGYEFTLSALKKNRTEFPVAINLGHYSENGKAYAVVFISDITDKNRTEEELLKSKLLIHEEAEALKFLNDVGNQLWQMDDFRHGLDKILSAAMQLTKSDKGNIQLFDSEKQVLQIVSQIGFEPEFLAYFNEVRAADRSACGTAMRDKVQVVIEDVSKTWSGEMKDIARKSGFRAVQSTPLLGRDGSAIGMISTHFKTAGTLNELALRRIKLLARIAQNFIERNKFDEMIQKQNMELEFKVSERTKALLISLEREKELSDLKSRFVSMASHEFRTPLAAISTSISLIENYIHQEQLELRKKHIDRIKGSVNNLVDILNDFLSLDKLEQGKIEVTNERVDLYALAEDLIEEVRGMLKPFQDINLSHTGQKQIIVDKKILKNILLNLLSNAVKYSGEGKIIYLSIEVGNRVSISIKDHGIGIPENEQEKLFSKFFRARNAANIQGTGLGLNIVKRYVDLLDGEISFVSKQDEGTTFTLVLPATAG